MINDGRTCVKGSDSLRKIGARIDHFTNWGIWDSTLLGVHICMDVRSWDPMWRRWFYASLASFGHYKLSILFILWLSTIKKCVGTKIFMNKIYCGFFRKELWSIYFIENDPNFVGVVHQFLSFWFIKHLKWKHNSRIPS